MKQHEDDLRPRCAAMIRRIVSSVTARGPGFLSTEKRYAHRSCKRLATWNGFCAQHRSQADDLMRLMADRPEVEE